MVNLLSQTINISLYLNRPDNNGFARRRFLASKQLAIPQQGAYIDDAEITLSPGDKIQAQATFDNAVHYVISGVEREVV